MPSLIFNNYWDQTVRGVVANGTAAFKVLLVTSGYVENKDTHEDRADITSEVGAGNGYVSGGATATVTVTKDNTNDRIVISLGGTTWTTSAGQTLTARKALWYLSTGTTANDILVLVNDFGTDNIASNGGTLTLPASTITLQN